MSNDFARRFMAYENEYKQSLGALLGIATGVLADRQLLDDEVRFLNTWLTEHDELAHSWPGDVVHARIKNVLADGIISEEERSHLVETLRQLVGGRIEELAASTHVSELVFDEVVSVSFPGAVFCLTGDFVYGPRPVCEQEIAKRGGQIGKGITKKLQYLVVGGLGSAEWKHGSFGTKIEKAIQYKRAGLPILIVHEDKWASHL
jgi:NAD-dependent DNA ligase